MTRKQELEQLITMAQTELQRIVTAETVSKMNETTDSEDSFIKEGNEKLLPLGFRKQYDEFERVGDGYVEQISLSSSDRVCWLVYNQETEDDLIDEVFNTIDGLLEARPSKLPVLKKYRVTYEIMAFDKNDARWKTDPYGELEGLNPVFEVVD